jgi:hypothetical protein
MHVTYLHTLRNTKNVKKLVLISTLLLYPGSDPIGGRKDNGPEIGRWPVELESHFEKVQAVFFRSDNPAAYFQAILWIVEEKGLPHVEMVAHSEETAVSIDDLGFGLLLDLLALLVFGQNYHVQTQQYPFASTAVLRRGHQRILLLYFTPIGTA